MKRLILKDGIEVYEDLTSEEVSQISTPNEHLGADWLHPYAIRINIPWEAFFEEGYSVFATYFVSVQKLPVERVEGRIHGYCNYIEPQFVEIIENDPRILIEYRDEH